MGEEKKHSRTKKYAYITFIVVNVDGAHDIVDELVNE